ncbi:MAG: nucleotidyltransferase domain-containing protein [Bacteroidota bacterium]
MDKEKVITAFKSAVLQVDNGAIIYLYGSRARGDNKPDSDWDFLILTNLPKNKKTKDKFRNKIFDFELEYEQPISTIIHNKNEWNDYEITPLYQTISREGVRI